MEGQVDKTFLADQVAALKSGFGQRYGWSPEAMSDGKLHIVRRPETVEPELVAVAISFGDGSALAIADDYLDWARALPTMKDYLALHISFLLRFVAEGHERGDRLGSKTSNIGFALATPPVSPDPYAGHTLAPYGREELKQTWRDGVFHNGLGETDEPEFFARVDRAVGVRSADGELVALAAIWDQAPGVEEIGVDVARNARGFGLGKAVVAAALESILAARNAPFYSCGASNVRSQRTALSCGFVPVCSFAGIARA